MASRLSVVTVGPYRPAVPADGATLITGGSQRPDGTRRGVLICHSAGQRHHQQAMVEWWPVPAALAASGSFACLACDLGDPDVEVGPTSAAYSWGNDHALSCVSQAYDFLLGPAVGARPGRVLLAGTSMGALLALNWAVRNRDLVAGAILACPVLDLGAVRHHADLAAGVLAAYPSDPGGPAADLTRHSPIEYARELAGLPIRIYASRNDTVAADTQSCEAFAGQVGGGAIGVVDLGEVGHWPVGTPTDDALAFARALP